MAGAGILVAGTIVAATSLGYYGAPQLAEAQLSKSTKTTVQLVGGQSTPATKASLHMATLKVDKMYCASCPFIVRQSLENVNGVVKADVSYRTKTAIVTFDPRKTSPVRLASSVSELGYPTSVIK